MLTKCQQNHHKDGKIFAKCQENFGKCWQNVDKTMSNADNYRQVPAAIDQMLSKARIFDKFKKLLASSEER